MKFTIRDLLLVTIFVAVYAVESWVSGQSSAFAAEPKGDKEAAFEKWADAPRLKSDNEYRSRLKELGLESKDAIPVFASKIGNENPRDRRAAAHGLALIGNQDVSAALPALLQAAKDTDKDVRRTAVMGLGDIGAPPEHAIPAIVAVLESDESYTAARALAEFGPKAEPAIGPLTKALSYKNSIARSSSAEALGKIGPAARASAPALRKALKDEDESARGFAAWAIWKVEGIASPDVIDALIELLETHDILTGLRAIETLGDIGPPAKAALPALAKARTKGHPFFAAPVIWATGCIHEEKDLVPRLMLELSNKEPNTRSGASWALGKMGPDAREAVPELRKLFFDDKIGYGQLFVRQALERIEGREKTAEWIEPMKKPRK